MYHHYYISFTLRKPHILDMIFPKAWVQVPSSRSPPQQQGKEEAWQMVSRLFCRDIPVMTSPDSKHQHDPVHSPDLTETGQLLRFSRRFFHCLHHVAQGARSFSLACKNARCPWQVIQEIGVISI